MRRLLYHILFLVARRLILVAPEANRGWHPHRPQHKPGVATYGQLNHPTLHRHDADRPTMQSLGSQGDRPSTLRLTSQIPFRGRRHREQDRSPTR
jgi:hypothetical protein